MLFSQYCNLVNIYFYNKKTSGQKIADNKEAPRQLKKTYTSDILMQVITRLVESVEICIDFGSL